ncbi:DUF3102 domain-containing protein [Ruegeria sp. 2012CJ41-6]|uniref:DUF3102 domain-containing protein n=1 Tax=Ruegeria spongiae TaxID=2942209 RepID=A0ABT0Q814_9RHOB|nr:DUF3102 domain-containing protein [Ruegeria spongiae]MCL6285995.1 DUF3102 domain-containing protein [Ruegeria spongiae]
MLDRSERPAYPTTSPCPSLTETARLAVSVNSKHREVQRLGRTAKEIAAEIGEELIKVKQKLAHGEFMPWVKAECAFSERSAQDYMKIAKAKTQRAADFNRCDSIREVLAMGKPKAEPQTQRRAATLDDLRKVERLRALRDDPGAAEGERKNAQAKLDEIEKEVGPIDGVKQQPKGRKKNDLRKETRRKACTIMDRLTPIMKPKVRSGVINALMIAYGDNPEKLDELLTELTH